MASLSSSQSGKIILKLHKHLFLHFCFPCTTFAIIMTAVNNFSVLPANLCQNIFLHDVRVPFPHVIKAQYMFFRKGIKEYNVKKQWPRVYLPFNIWHHLLSSRFVSNHGKYGRLNFICAKTTHIIQKLVFLRLFTDVG